jgi:hypothetical protein
VLRPGEQKVNFSFMARGIGQGYSKEICNGEMQVATRVSRTTASRGKRGAVRHKAERKGSLKQGTFCSFMDQRTDRDRGKGT